MTSGFVVENGGMQSSIQDKGRVGVSDIGLTQSGVMDEMAFGYANMLVGNALNTAVIEVAMGGLVLRSQGTHTLVVTGAMMHPTCNGEPFEMWKTIVVHDGDEIRLGFATAGQFAYIAVAGGFITPLSYGSYSTSLKEGLGGIAGRKLLKGDLLSSHGEVHRLVRALEPHHVPTYPQHITLRVVKGYQEVMFDEAAQRTFFGATYTFKGEGNRMGYRLSGDKVIPKQTGILSEPICYGAIQLPTHGEPIVLLKERQTIGGYPKIGSVITVDCFKLAQLKTGGTVRFEEISAEDALEITRKFYTFFTF